ncbi:MAG: PAS domain S-box protein [Dehalococcoidia bacterium]
MQPVGSDRTERRATGHEFDQFIDASHEAIITMDAGGRVTRWNRGAAALFGWSREEALGSTVAELIVPEEMRDAHFAGWNRSLASPRRGTVGPYEIPALRRDGTRATVEIALSLLPSGREFVAFIRDMTEVVSERAQQLELRRAKEFTDLVLNNTGLLVATVALDGSFVSANARTCEVLGYSEEELTGMLVPQVVLPEDLPLVMGAFASATGSPISRFEVSIVRKDGELRKLSFGLSPLLEDGKLQGYVGAAEDITDRQRTQAALANSEKLASLASLAGGVAHDFNNLLTAILGNVAVIRNLPEGDPEREHALDDIETAGSHAAELASQMLAYAGTADVSKREVNVSALLSTMEPLLHAVLPRNVRIEVNAPATPLTIQADPTQVRQVVLNIAVNAAEAMAGAGGQVSLSTGSRELDAKALARCVGAGGALAGKYVYIKIADDGPGMDPGVAARVFDPFFSTKFAGRGLGLSAVFGIVRGHHGVVEVVSRTGKGSTFTVYLPAN